MKVDLPQPESAARPITTTCEQESRGWAVRQRQRRRGRAGGRGRLGPRGPRRGGLARPLHSPGAASATNGAARPQPHLIVGSAHDHHVAGLHAGGLLQLLHAARERGAGHGGGGSRLEGRALGHRGAGHRRGGRHGLQLCGAHPAVDPEAPHSAASRRVGPRGSLSWPCCADLGPADSFWGRRSRNPNHPRRLPANRRQPGRRCRRRQQLGPSRRLAQLPARGVGPAGLRAPLQSVHPAREMRPAAPRALRPPAAAHPRRSTCPRPPRWVRRSAARPRSRPRELDPCGPRSRCVQGWLSNSRRCAAASCAPASRCRCFPLSRPSHAEHAAPAHCAPCAARDANAPESLSELCASDAPAGPPSRPVVSCKSNLDARPARQPIFRPLHQPLLLSRCLDRLCRSPAHPTSHLPLLPPPPSPAGVGHGAGERHRRGERQV